MELIIFLADKYALFLRDCWSKYTGAWVLVVFYMGTFPILYLLHLLLMANPIHCFIPIINHNCSPPPTDKQEEEEEEPAKILSLPNELTVEIFSYLGPKDLLRCAQVCSSWSGLARDGSLWKTLHPMLWAQGKGGNNVTRSMLLFYDTNVVSRKHMCSGLVWAG